VRDEDNGLVGRLLDCQREIEERKDDLTSWTDSLEELAEIQDAFKTKGEYELEGKTILDVGTDCIKPLYIALKFKPNKIIGIDENLSYSYTSDIEQKSKLFTDTKIRLYNCSLFNKGTLTRIMEKERISRFDFVLVSKTLHHLRTEECVLKHEHQETEDCCVYRFDERKIFGKLLELGRRAIIYETIGRDVKDLDKTRGRGEYFTASEMARTLKYLFETYKDNFQLIRPMNPALNNEKQSKIESLLRKVDTVCFYVQEQNLKDA
jgi:hypothetical protein